MTNSWVKLAEKSDGKYEVGNFQRAMYQVVYQQCLYLRFRNQATAYRLISEYRQEFTDALDLLGLKLRFNDRYEYCYVAQDEGQIAAMDLAETYFYLTLRYVYHQRASVGDLESDGSACVGIPEFQESYRELCGQTLDGRADTLRTLLKLSRRHGLAKEGEPLDGDPQAFTVVILPAIADILSEYTVGRLGAHLGSAIEGVVGAEVSEIGDVA